MAIKLCALAHVELVESLEHACDAMMAPCILRAIDHDNVLPCAGERRKRVRVNVDNFRVAAMMCRRIHWSDQAEAQQSHLD